MYWAWRGAGKGKYYLTKWIVVPVCKIMEIGGYVAQERMIISSVLNKFSLRCGCLALMFWNSAERSWLAINLGIIMF